MKRLALLLWFGLAPTLIAADTYTIKLKKRDKGDTLAIESEERSSSSFVVLGPDGKEIEKKEDVTTVVQKYREAVMEKETGKRPNKLKRTYDQATIGTAAFAYHGKTVVVTKVGEAYQFTIDGKELKGEAAGNLAREFSDPNKSPDDNEKHFLPAKPVAVGETWSPNMREMFKAAFGEGEDKVFDLAKATGTAKLSKVYSKDQLTFGVIDIDVAAPLLLMPGNNFPCEAGSKFELKMTLDVCIDGTQETGSLKAEMKVMGVAKVLNNGKETGGKIKFSIAATTTDSKLQYMP